MNRGYVKLYRKSNDSGWLRNPSLWTFWCWCLMKASYKECDVHIGYQTEHLMPGDFIFGRKAAAAELGMTERTVRTSLEALSRSQNIAIKTTNKYSVISIVNWNTYQTEEPTGDQQNDQQPTNKRPATDQQPTTNKNIKNLKKVKNGKNLFLNIVANEVENAEPSSATTEKRSSLLGEKVTVKEEQSLDEEAIRLANLLLSEIITQNSKSRLAAQNNTAREKTVTDWARDIEKLIGIDQQEPSTVEEVIFFATHDDFWGPNILSGKKLREKWDTLTRKMNQKGQKHGNAKPSGIEPFSDIPVSMRGGIWD